MNPPTQLRVMLPRSSELLFYPRIGYTSKF